MTVIPNPLEPATTATDDVYPLIQVIAYHEHDLIEQVCKTPAEAAAYADQWRVVWINIDGPSDVDLVQQIGEQFGLHPLAIEDVLHHQQRAKVEIYPDYYFIVARMVSPGERLTTEQIGIFLGDRYVITFQERAGGDCLNPLRDRIRRGADQLRAHGTAYLTYAMLDVIVDAYFPVLEQYGETLEAIEDTISVKPQSALLSDIHEVKRDLLNMRRAIWPLRDVLYHLLHDADRFTAQELNFYLRDCYDHTMRVIDLVEMNRELCADLMDFYLSNVSNRTNEVMKVLAIISTIFMPMTFIAGIYGMNFDTAVSPLNMPELKWAFGYPFALLLMASLALSMIFFFRRKGWL